MKLLTADLTKKLNTAGYYNDRPICKFFTPWGSNTWLITGMEDGILYGYADLGMGCVEWGGISTIEELESIKGPVGLGVERDLYWKDNPEVSYLDKDSLVGI